MLTRRQIRIKVMQAVYAHYNGNLLSLKEGTNAIAKSCQDMLLLHTTLLYLFKALDELYEEVEKGEMPLNSYTWTHSEANLTQEQINAVVTWGKKVQADYKQQMASK